MAKKNEWRVFGRHYSAVPDPTQREGTINFTEGHINLPEQISNLRMGSAPSEPRPISNEASVDKGCFGRPINIDLALHLIKNALNNTSSFGLAITGKTEFTESEDPTNFVKGLLDLSYGVTFDKTIVLKILSQPNCEGLRTYPCSRNSKYPDKDPSIVLVGVDANGYDLNYNPDESTALAATVSTKSLIVEYGFPPTGTGKLDSGYNLKEDVPKNYVLLKRAGKMKKP